MNGIESGGEIQKGKSSDRPFLAILRALSVEWYFLYADWKAVIRPASSR